MGQIIKLTEAQLKKVVSNIIQENEAYGGNYMFFSNLEQMKRQCELLLNLDKNMVNQLLEQGHDWADDHISSAKENIDQVFDFMMNETKGHKDDQQPVSVDMDQFSLNEEGQLDEKCWDGYKQVGSKMKSGKKVPNCVPTKGIKPKNESTGEIDESKNCPTDPAKWAASKAKAKAKFDVYPSAYANGFAAKDYKAKGGGWKKCK
jgi:hypothetical protein